MIQGVLRAFDSWVGRGDFTARDLGAYRILFSLYAIATFPSFRWVSEYPASLYVPPPGPFALLAAPPPPLFMIAVEVGLAASLGAMLIGLRTRSASVAATVLLLIGFGFSYSVGKIDHTILFVLTPALMAMADWGRAYSVDSSRRPTDPHEPFPQWPMRFFALVIGLAFVTAAYPKVLSGWLLPGSQAVRGHFFRNYHVNDRTGWLADSFMQVQPALLWESVDWASVALEGVVILAVVNWRLFRVAIALATLFHLGVLLMLNIGFSNNVMAYGALVLWSQARPLPYPHSVTALIARYRYAVVAAVAVALILLTPEGNAAPVIAPAVLFVGGGISAWYLARQAQLLLRRSSRRPDDTHALPG